MDDDFNTAAALGAVFSLVGEANSFISDGLKSAEAVEAAQAARGAIVDLMGRFGIDMEAEAGPEIPEGVLALAAEMAGFTGDDREAAANALIERRAAARKEKDWAIADAIRDGLGALGITIEDTAQGARLVL